MPETAESEINALGKEGWRLHTCEPIVVGTVPTFTEVFVVMDRAYMSEPDPKAKVVKSETAMAMKG